ncbi:hypothetical protein [Cereibacter changlensis]|uniref:hypothetical protein n=1 Tax=Cereibacter changlensis TaxID=402884 RepID=UPI004033772F
MADSGSDIWATTGLPRDLIDLSADLFAVYDSDDRLFFANPAYRAAYHCDPAERRSWRDIMVRTTRRVAARSSRPRTSRPG